MSTIIDDKTLTMVNEQPRLIALLREDVTCVFQRDPAARSTWEVVTTYPGIHALLWHRISHALWIRKFRYAARILSFIARMFTQIDIHPGATIGRRFFIDHGCGVVIGETAEIGNDVTLYHGVTLGGVSWNMGKRHPTLADGVVVGAGAKILGPIAVGRGVRVGANSVVIQDVPEGMTVVGIPGRIVLPESQRRITAQGIDLDHHLMPDPVGKAISCLLDRIAYLEKQLAHISHTYPTAAAESLAVERRTLSRRLDVGSATPSPPLSPCDAPQRRLDALATDECEKCGLGVSGEPPALPATNDCVTCTETCDPAHVAASRKRATH